MEHAPSNTPPCWSGQKLWVPRHGHNLSSRFYLFVPQDLKAWKSYKKGWKVTDIFPVNTVGVVTGQDKKTISFTLEGARLLAKEHGLPDSVIRPILYRPFDIRYVVYDRSVVTRQRLAVMRHLSGGAPALLTARQATSRGDLPAFVSKSLVDAHAITAATSITTVFPLYLQEETETSSIFGDSTSRANIAPAFREETWSALECGSYRGKAGDTSG